MPALDELDGRWERIATSAEHLGRRYDVLRYVPRVQSGFARIERFVDRADRTSFWRVTDGANVTSYFGRTAHSRVAQPGSPRRIYQWLLDRMEDDRGNATDYIYKREDLSAVRTTAPWERSRPHAQQPQQYLKRIRYGNREPPAEPGAVLPESVFAYEVVFDYGEHGELPDFDAPETTGLEVSFEEARPWPQREDVFSTYRPGFDLRTRRLCRRVLVFHRFDALGPELLTTSLDLAYTASAVVTTLASATRRGYVREADGSYRAQAMPPLQFEYSAAEIQPSLRVVEPDIDDVGQRVEGARVRVVDLDAEGAPGILWAHGRHLVYKAAVGEEQFGPARPLPTVPVTAARLRLMDLDGDGRLSLAALDGPIPGTYERDTSGGWSDHRPLLSRATVSAADPRARLMDADGDGLADILIDRGRHFEWYRSLGRDGFAAPIRVLKPEDEDGGPQLVYGDPRVAIFHADMTGDGLPDLVRVAYGSVAYWPNQGTRPVRRTGRHGGRTHHGHVRRLLPAADPPGRRGWERDR